MLNSSIRNKRRDRHLYIDLDGRSWDLEALDPEERRLVGELRRRASGDDWFEFDNFWLNAVAQFYDKRGISRKKTIQSAVFQIAQDLSSRIAVTKGYALYGDYRDDLEEIATTRFKTRRAFCQATGLSEDMLSHVLAGRKDLSIRTLSEALAKIGYGIRAVPMEPAPKKGKSSNAKAS
jgi:hypothetical protein